MQMQVAIDPSARFIRCTVSGRADLAAAQGLFGDFAAARQKEMPRRLLLDLLGVVGQLQMSEQFSIGNTSSDVMQGFTRVAVVQAPRANNGFGALVAKNRGLNMEVFATEAEALSWLLR